MDCTAWCCCTRSFSPFGIFSPPPPPPPPPPPLLFWTRTRTIVFLPLFPSYQEDELRILTPLGRRQAEYTGKRLARLFGELPWQQQQRHGEEEDAAVMVTEGTDSEQPTPCAIQVLRVSGMTRAVETANIIASYLPDSVRYEAPDPLLNEGRFVNTDALV